MLNFNFDQAECKENADINHHAVVPYETTGHECPDTEITVEIPDLPKYTNEYLNGREINGVYKKMSKFRNGYVTYRKVGLDDTDYQIWYCSEAECGEEYEGWVLGIPGKAKDYNLHHPISLLW